ncbi:MAG: sugar-binding transcriptional regulator [Proteobacteria bacterium]|nr:sugar-binding transcriptional regulator [Pseudomonadota bacterium]
MNRQAAHGDFAAAATMDSEELLLLRQADPEEQLATRAAWLYYIGNSTQAQIAKKLGLTRLRVNRLLALARDEGLVQIKVTGRLSGCIELEHELRQRFGLIDAVVVPTPADATQLRSVVGTAAGQYLGEQLKDGMSIGVGWGRTLRLSLTAIPRKHYRNLSVVSLIGGLTQSSAVNPHETASHLADLVGGQCYYFAGPAFTDTAASRDMLMNQPVLRDVFERGRSVDLAFVSVGELSPQNTMKALRLITPDEMESLRAVGAEGDLCSHWIDKHGALVDHPLNGRAVALTPDHLRKVRKVILVSGGKTKLGVMLGAIRGRYVNALVTDEQTARALVDLA